jgi:hypothetical protein
MPGIQRAVVQVGAGHVGVHEYGDDEAAVGAVGQRVGEGQVGERVGVAAAVVALIHQAEEARLAHAAEHGARHLAITLPGVGKRLDLACHESAHLLAQQLVLGREVGVAHGRAHMRNTPNCGRSGMGAFRLALRPSASTRRVSAGSMTPSSHSRALA